MGKPAVFHCSAARTRRLTCAPGKEAENSSPRKLISLKGRKTYLHRRASEISDPCQQPQGKAQHRLTNIGLLTMTADKWTHRLNELFHLENEPLCTETLAVSFYYESKPPPKPKKEEKII